VAQTQLRAIQPVLALVTAEHVCEKLMSAFREPGLPCGGRRPCPPPPELAPLSAGCCTAGRAVERGHGGEAERGHVAQTQRREIRPIPRLMTAEYIARSATPAEPAPWLTVTASCRSSPPPPRAAGTRATAGGKRL
jgi:hypothetical protein